MARSVSDMLNCPDPTKSITIHQIQFLVIKSRSSSTDPLLFGPDPALFTQYGYHTLRGGAGFAVFYIAIQILGKAGGGGGSVTDGNEEKNLLRDNKNLQYPKK